MSKRQIYEINRDQDVMIEDSNDINDVFKYHIEDQYALAAQNGVPNLDELDILYINTVGSIMYVTRNTMDHIKGKFCGVSSAGCGINDF